MIYLSLSVVRSHNTGCLVLKHMHCSLQPEDFVQLFGTTVIVRQFLFLATFRSTTSRHYFKHKVDCLVNLSTIKWK